MKRRPMILNALDPRIARERFTAAAAQHQAVWNLDEGGGTASLHIYGAIGGFWGDVDAAQIVPAIRALDVATLEVYINSPGGDVWDGIAIREALRSSSAYVVTHVDGLAASAASFIATAGDDVVIGDNAQLMIHDAWTIMLGNADEMRETADLLDLISENIASMYAQKAGGDTADWRALMKAETWYSAQEAIDAGLADRLSSAAPVPAAAASFDLSMFAHAGRAAAAAPIPAAALAAPRKETRMNRAQLLAALNAGTITQEQYDNRIANLDAAAEAAREVVASFRGDLAPSAGAPGAPVAAEFAAGPQGSITPAGRTHNRPVSRASLLPALVDAAKRGNVAEFAATINNALDNVVQADDAGEGFLHTQREGQLWQASPAGRPTIESLGGVKPLTGPKLEGWVWTLPTPKPELYIGNATEVPSDLWHTEPVSEDAEQWAKANRVERIYTDLGSPNLVDSLFDILDANYEGVSDSHVFTKLEAAATPLAGATSVVNAIAKIYLQLKRIGAVGSKFWLSEDLFLGFSELTVSDLPAWLANATGFVNLADGSVSLTNVFDVDVSFDLSAGELLAYDSRGATVYESPKVKLQANAIGFGAVDLAWHAYGGTLINDPRAIIKATAVPVVPVFAAASSSKKS